MKQIAFIGAPLMIVANKPSGAQSRAGRKSSALVRG